MQLAALCLFAAVAKCQSWILKERRSNDPRNPSLLSPISQQGSTAECAQEFFASLAAFTEKLLLELDETITIDDVQVASK